MCRRDSYRAVRRDGAGGAQPGHERDASGGRQHHRWYVSAARLREGAEMCIRDRRIRGRSDRISDRFCGNRIRRGLLCPGQFDVLCAGDYEKAEGHFHRVSFGGRHGGPDFRPNRFTLGDRRGRGLLSAADDRIDRRLRLLYGPGLST